MSEYSLVFDKKIVQQLQQLAKNRKNKAILSSMFDKIEEYGPRAGKLLDSKLQLYECKNKHPPIRLFFQVVEASKEVYVFEYVMKTSKTKQQSFIDRLKKKYKD